MTGLQLLASKLSDANAANTELAQTVEQLNCRLSEVVAENITLADTLNFMTEQQKRSKPKLLAELDDWKAMVASLQEDRDRLREVLRTGCGDEDEVSELRFEVSRLQDQLEMARAGGDDLESGGVTPTPACNQAISPTPQTAAVAPPSPPGTASKAIRPAPTRRFGGFSLVFRAVNHITTSCKETVSSTLQSVLVGVYLLTGKANPNIVDFQAEKDNPTFVV